VEEYLDRLARETKPKDLPEGDDAREKRSAAWAKWWKDHKDRVVMVDRAAPAIRERYLGYTLLLQNNNNQIQEIDKAHKVRWTITGLMNPQDAQVLPRNRVLIAEYNAQQVTERNFKGEVLWRKHMPGHWPLHCERLRNGNTFIVARDLLME